MNKCGVQLAWAFLLLCGLAMAQSGPLLTGVEPTAGKVGDTVTVTGEKLEGATLQEVLLAGLEEDPPENFYPAEILERTEDKILIKIPQVPAGAYTLALNVADIFYISPAVRITVE